MTPDITQDDPYHPILDQPWIYDVVGLCYTRVLNEPQNSQLDLTLQQGNTIRRLRFTGVQSLVIEEGFPMRTSGMCFLDLSRRQLDGLGVHVTDFEASPGKVEFWARDVVDLDSSKE